MTLLKTCIVFLLFSVAIHVHAEVIEVNLYSQKISIRYDKSIVISQQVQASDTDIKQYYTAIQQTNFNVILDSFKKVKSELRLNDWFYYELIRNTSRMLFKNETENYRQVFTWFMLSESGYNVVIGYQETFELFVYSKSDVYKRSIIGVSGKEYVSLDNFAKMSNSMSYCQFIPGSENRNFNFSIDLPQLQGDKTIEVKKEFSFNGKTETYRYQVSQNFLAFMETYPKLNSKDYFNIQISQTTRESLIPQLKKRITGLSNEEAVRYLLSFVRLTFSPKFDSENKPVDFAPMIAEETLFYEYGDCEGKSVLFHFLVKELVGSPMIALLYPNHINVAVKLNQTYGSAIQYNNTLYTVCEPNAVGDAINFDQPGSSERYASARVLAIE